MKLSKEEEVMNVYSNTYHWKSIAAKDGMTKFLYQALLSEYSVSTSNYLIQRTANIVTELSGIEEHDIVRQEIRTPKALRRDGSHSHNRILE